MYIYIGRYISITYTYNMYSPNSTDISEVHISFFV